MDFNKQYWCNMDEMNTTDYRESAQFLVALNHLIQDARQQTLLTGIADYEYSVGKLIRSLEDNKVYK